MAFFHDVPEKKRKKKTGDTGAWEEEGSRYRGAKSVRGSGSASEKRTGGGSGRSARNSYVEKAGEDTRRGGPGRETRGTSGGRRANPEGRKRPDSRRDSRWDGEYRAPRPGRREAVEERAQSQLPKPEKHYQDYEYLPEKPAAMRPEVSEPEMQDNLLTGRNPIREALKSGRDFEKLLVQKGELSGSAREIVAMAKERNIQVQVVDKSRLDEIAPHHQGLIGFASAYQYATVEDILETAKERGEDPFLILLDGVTDPHNLGAVIRTADCAGAHGVIVPQHRSVGLTPAAVKASAGAVEHVKVARVVNLNRTIEELQKQNIWVYAVTMDGTDYERVNFAGGTALVIGAEGEGISRLTAEKCDAAVSLPMAGKIESLNASVAAGIMMYRVYSCRRK